jgi:hypothetical protein
MVAQTQELLEGVDISGRGRRIDRVAVVELKKLGTSSVPSPFFKEFSRHDRRDHSGS